jgi:hypothetical protein
LATCHTDPTPEEQSTRSSIDAHWLGVGGGDVAVAAAVAAAVPAATLIIRMNIMFFYVKKLH